tara:strand:- start:109 stop:426 length:318 start_codon:yes stop_codon:yes gene_type:complete
MKIEEPKYTPGSDDEHGSIEARDNYEKWYYETYVRHCHENDCWGCDYCVPYDETMNGRYEGYEQAMKNKQKQAQASQSKAPKIEYDYRLRRYVDVANGKLVERGD